MTHRKDVNTVTPSYIETGRSASGKHRRRTGLFRPVTVPLWWYLSIMLISWVVWIKFLIDLAEWFIKL